MWDSGLTEEGTSLPRRDGLVHVPVVGPVRRDLRRIIVRGGHHLRGGGGALAAQFGDGLLGTSHARGRADGHAGVLGGHRILLPGCRTPDGLEIDHGGGLVPGRGLLGAVVVGDGVLGVPLHVRRGRGQVVALVVPRVPLVDLGDARGRQVRRRVGRALVVDRVGAGVRGRDRALVGRGATRLHRGDPRDDQEDQQGHPHLDAAHATPLFLRSRKRRPSKSDGGSDTLSDHFKKPLRDSIAPNCLKSQGFYVDISAQRFPYPLHKHLYKM